MAAYTRCLRCAGASRRPASGSELSLRVLSWHAVSWDPGEPDHRPFQISDVGVAFAVSRPARHSRNPAIRFARGGHLRGYLVRTIATACQVACPPVRIRPTFRSAHGGFYFQAFSRSVALPAAGYDYNSVWTPLLAGLSPARTAASFAALIRGYLDEITSSHSRNDDRSTVVAVCGPVEVAFYTQNETAELVIEAGLAAADE